ncbi:MAG: hypothetical protein AMXMBFR12_03400 [Candidatus Babeliales bacterium]
MKNLFTFFIIFQLPLLGMEVTFFNVGQGNCTLVTYPGQKTMLVDAGSSSVPSDDPKCMNALHDLVTRIINKTPNKELFVVASHADKDHINKISEACQQLLKKKFKLSFLLGGSKKNYEKTEIGKKLLTFIKNNSKTCSLKFAADIKGTGSKRFNSFKQLVPTYCTVLSALVNQKDVNDTSLVLKVSDQNQSVFLPGDATENATKEIIRDITRKKFMKSEVLEVSHHGAETHNCTHLPLLNAVNPKICIISSGLMYKHPRFEVIKTLATYCTRKQLTNAPHHMLTFQKSNHIFPFTGKTNETRLNLIACFNNEFCTAQTSYPIYNTVDSGTISYTQQGIEASNKKSFHNERGIGALQGIQTPQFNTIRFLFFNNMEIESTQFKHYITALPNALEYMDLRNNLIGNSGLEHLISLYKNHGKDLIVKLGDNRLINKKTFTAVLKKPELRSIARKKRMLLTFSNKGLEEEDTVESLELYTNHNGKIPFQHFQALAYAKDNSKASEEIAQNKIAIKTDDDDEMVFYLSADTSNLLVKNLALADDEISYNWLHISDICFLFDPSQTVAGITTDQSSTLFDYVNTSYKNLEGQFKYTNPKKPWKTIGKEFWTLDKPGVAYYHERTPFSKNGQLVTTVSAKNKCINIYQLDPLVFDVDHVKLHKSISEEDLKSDLGHKIADVKRVSFTDNDHSLKLHFTDKTHGELRFIL